MNPEFRRNLILHLSPHRLMAMPTVFGAFVLVAYTLQDRSFDWGTGLVAEFAYYFFTFLWGTKLAAESIIGEVVDGTWDQQRMSAMRPWRMAWGKLFGATVYVWYGNAVALAVYAASHAARVETGTLLAALAVMVAAGILAHAVSMMVSLIAVQRRRSFGRVQVFSYHLLGLICGIPAVWTRLGGGSALDVTDWYGTLFPLVEFTALALIALALWSMVGVWQLLRIELQMPNPPWVWLGFVVFSMIFFGGFVYIPPSLERLVLAVPGTPFAAALVSGACIYIAVLSEPKDSVRFRRLAHFAGTGNGRRLMHIFPRALLTLPLFLIAGIVTMVLSAPAETALVGDLANLLGAIAAAMLFVIRDLGFMYFMSFGRPDGQGDSKAFVYILLSYTLAPALLLAMGAGDALALFFPDWRQNPVFSVLCAGLEAAAVWALLFKRWQRFTRQPAER